MVANLNAAAVDGCMPERTVLLRVDVERAAGRAEERGGEEAQASDRFEREGSAFQERIAAAFERIAAADPERVAVVDAVGTVEEVHARVLEAVGR